MRVPRKSSPAPENPEKKPASKRRKGFSPGVAFSLFSAVFTISMYYACTIRPEKFWMAGFSGFLIPPVLLLQSLLLIFWLFKKPFYALIPALALFFGIRFISASFGWHYLITEDCRDFRVLSLNARTFGSMEKPHAEKTDKTSETVQAIVDSKADVICIQEMFDFPGVRPFNVIRTLKKAGYPHVFYSIARKSWGSSVGMAIVSKHPILEKEIIRKKEGSNNQIILARIRIGDRHISVINMHLQSVALKDDELAKTGEAKELIGNTFSIGKKLKKGFQIRASQIDELLNSARSEGAYVVICGDLNDTPYSNAYLRLRDEFRNSFEEKGRGFGFTFNGGIPFLRIDQQFFGKGLRVTRFDVIRKFPVSDHYGTEACYAFKE